MNRLKYNILAGVMFLLFSAGAGFADDDEHDKDHGKHHNNEKRQSVSVNNDTYAQECGVCHFAYQPWLLPSGSWKKILGELPSHFGEEIPIDEETQNTIDQYLAANAADRVSVKRSRKIMKSLRGNTPVRVTEIPHILEKHHDLDPAILDRPSIGSLGNCIACHTTADQGDYDDDSVTIPR
ncbi:MAG: diheme cytochrome c [Desulfotignum sp.]|nr:diheme cytochrome c [Desulfotignum sp.]